MEFFIGQIIMFGGNFPIRNFSMADGSILSISQNQALFSLYGTMYGGDGRTSFALPELRGRVPIHRGQGPGLSDYQIGQRGGVENVTLSTAQIPSHGHVLAIEGTSEDGNTNELDGNLLANSSVSMYHTISGINPDAQLSGVSLANTGGSQSHTNIQPFQVITFQVCMVGIFPSRN